MEVRGRVLRHPFGGGVEQSCWRPGGLTMRGRVWQGVVPCCMWSAVIFGFSLSGVPVFGGPPPLRIAIFFFSAYRPRFVNSQRIRARSRLARLI